MEIDSIKQKTSSIFKNYKVRKALLFGSVARNQQTASSDIDILIETDKDFGSLFQFIRLENELTQVLNMKVDMVGNRSIKPTLRKQILSDAIIIYEST